jgi:predicted Zn-dependent protease
MLMGWVKLQKGEAETAANYLTSYHAQKPDEPAGTRLLAEVFLRIGQASHAIEVLNRAVEQQSGDAQLVSLLGDAYQQTGDDAKAQEMLRLAVSMAPDSAPMRTRLAASLITSGEVAQGARELATVLASHPTIRRPNTCRHSPCLNRVMTVAPSRRPRRPGPIPWCAAGSASTLRT